MVVMFFWLFCKTNFSEKTINFAQNSILVKICQKTGENHVGSIGFHTKTSLDRFFKHFSTK